MLYLYTLFITLAVALAELLPHNSNVQVACIQDRFKCGDGICFMKDVLCDLYDDCDDGSDENNCTSHVCPNDEFRCNSGQCVSKKSRCDGEDDCADNSDEENCLQCNKDTWGLEAFKCKSNNKCIERKKLCNSIRDCPDGSDEDKTTCQNLQCSSDEFQCKTGHCMSNYMRCIGYDRCGDNSGETNCTECGYSAFKCEKENTCIPKKSLCDTEPDCEDGSDESESTCQRSTCSSGAFRCKSGQCVEDTSERHTLLCNGHNDCSDKSDKSDEENCTDCSFQAFICGSGECVHNYKLCNTIVDCSDGSDENEINCPDGSTPRVWTTFWHHSDISSNRKVTLQQLTEDMAVYYDRSVNSSITWPFSHLSKAWKYAKKTFGPVAFAKPGTGSQRLYVVLGKLKLRFEFSYTFSFTDPSSGYRNILDKGLRERNGWATENSWNFEKLFLNLGDIVRFAEEGEFNLADYKICYVDMRDILFYDIYIYLKGARSSDVLRWKANKFNKTLKVGKLNCFRDWLLPIYEAYGGATVFRNYFEILRVNMAKKKGVYSDSFHGFKQLNKGEFVHFWSGAAKANLLYLAKSMFTMDEIFMKQFAKAQTDFPNITYAGEKEVTTDVLDVLIGIALCISILFLVAFVVKVSLPYVIAKYNALVEQYW